MCGLCTLTTFEWHCLEILECIFYKAVWVYPLLNPVGTPDHTRPHSPMSCRCGVNERPVNRAGFYRQWAVQECIDGCLICISELGDILIGQYPSLCRGSSNRLPSAFLQPIRSPSDTAEESDSLAFDQSMGFQGCTACQGKTDAFLSCLCNMIVNLMNTVLTNFGNSCFTLSALNTF